MKFVTTNLFKIKNNFLRIAINCLISAVLTTALILLVLFANIPNPNLFIMMGLVIITSLFGFIPGFIPTAAMIVYSLWFFSTNNDFVTYTSINSTKVTVSIITSIISYAFVSVLNLFYERSTKRLFENLDALSKDNEHLRHVSKMDPLTRTKNRYSLRNDFPSLINQDIQVMLFDVDDFKNVNDSKGHHVGDLILSEVSKVTQEVFDEESVYRYGGDEFLVIKTKLPLSEFEEMAKRLQSMLTEIDNNGEKINIRISAGYTYGMAENVDDLRSMIRFADKLMYEVKHTDKNGLMGRKFDLVV